MPEASVDSGRGAPPVGDAADKAAVRPSQANYAGALFFILLIVGFTFQVPTILYAPMIFFAIAAGVLFFKDVFGVHSIDTHSVPAKTKRPLLVRLLLLALAIGGVCVLLYVGFIVLILILLSRGGGFG